MAGRRVLRLFIPSVCMYEETGLLIGQWNSDHSCCCITGLLPCTSDRRRLPVESLDAFFPSTNHHIEIVGIWENVADSTTVPLPLYKFMEQQRSWFHLLKVANGLPRCTPHGLGISPPSFDGTGSSSIIATIFDADKLSSTELLGGGLGTREDYTNLQSVAEGWRCGTAFVKDIVFGQSWNKEIVVRPFMPLEGKLTGSCSSLFYRLIYALLWLPYAVISILVDNRLMTSTRFLRSVFTLPASLSQLRHHSRSVLGAGSQDDDRQPAIRTLWFRNMIWRQLLDIALGVSVFLWCLNGLQKMQADSLMGSAELVAQQLQDLLHWMMGVPAGLKLNHELAQCLGHFFLYHIHLWIAYLTFLKAVWSDAIWYISVSGCLGLSVQLSFLQDLLSMMTLHIYCFYVYAARLYNLQMKGLTSLWRLFRGKKWNPLWGRVDSFAFNVNQLIIGTLLFTILLFLLPTTILFYGVFTGLRLLVLSVQGSLYKIVSLLNTAPLYLTVLRLVSSDVITDDVHFEVLQRMDGRPLYLALQLKPASLSKLYNMANNNPKSPVLRLENYSWGTLLKKIASGELIYPWIQPNKEKQH